MIRPAFLNIGYSKLVIVLTPQSVDNPRVSVQNKFKGMQNLKLESALLSDVGRRRKSNQDRGLARSDLGIYVVADGMGGHQGGETASQLCIEAVEETAQRPENQLLPDSELLKKCIHDANLRIFEKSKAVPTLQGMGTTVTALRVADGLATVAQVGDSRAYFWNKLGIWQLTRDHSLVQEKLRAGLITREQMKTDEMKNVITRSVGYDPGLVIDLFTVAIKPGDGILLCSDGLSGPLEDAELYDLLIGSSTPDEAVKKLVQMANFKGGEDNITAVVVRCLA